MNEDKVGLFETPCTPCLHEEMNLVVASVSIMH